MNQIPSAEVVRRAEGAPESKGSTGRGHDGRLIFGICVFLAVIVWVVFGQTLHHGFVNYDDDANVYNNPVVSKGLSLGNLIWAFTHTQVSRWVPLSTLVHMLDCQLYGLAPGGHHLTSLLLHAATAILLFVVLLELTGALWRSAFTAMVFAIHPLHVEAVAWVSALQYPLSGFFFMLTLWAYVRYVRHPESRIRYAAVTLLFALGLLSKEMLVTLPFVLLLLDYWPLGRMVTFTPRIFLKLVLEKLPLFILTIASGVATFLAASQSNSPDKLAFTLRVENAFISYVTYLWQMAWPLDLTCFYPLSASHLSLWKTGVALGLLLAVSSVAYVFRRTRPYLLVGWLWYVGMLVPVIGLVQISTFAHADRYTYLSQIGLYLMLIWGAADLCARWPRRRIFFGATGVVIALVLCAREQTSYWRNSGTLWEHAIALTTANAVAYCNLSDFLIQTGRMDEGLSHAWKALEIKPNYSEAENNIGVVLFKKGRPDEAILHYRKALETLRNNADVCFNLGNALRQQGHFDEAMFYLQEALELDPGYLEAHCNLALVFTEKGNDAEAVAQYEKALAIKPNDSALEGFLGAALARNGRLAEAAAHYWKAVQLSPQSVNLENNLAWLLATAPDPAVRDGTDAVYLAEQASRQAGGKNPAILDTLAAAYAEVGRFSEAVQTAQSALQLAQAEANTALAANLEGEIKLYQAGSPTREIPGPPSSSK